MPPKITQKQGGFVKYLVVFLFIVFVLSFLGVSLRDVVFSEMVKTNFNFILELLKSFWAFLISVYDSYFSPWLSYIWENIILALFGKLKEILN